MPNIAMHASTQAHIQTIESAQMNRSIPDFRAGDMLLIQLRVREGARERLQSFEGVVLARRNRSLQSTVTLRRLAAGEGVELVVPLYSPLLASIQVLRRRQVRKAKIYYLRDKSGKEARLPERRLKKTSSLKAQASEVALEQHSPAAEEEVRKVSIPEAQNEKVEKSV